MKKPFLMKGCLLLLMCLLMLFSMGVMASAKVRVIQDFDDYPSDSDLTEEDGIHVNEEYGKMKISLATRNAVQGNALKIVPNDTGAAFGYVLIPIAEDQQDWTGAEYLRMHFYASGGTVADPTYVGVTVEIDDASYTEGRDPERYRGRVGKPYYVAQTEEELETNPVTKKFTDSGIVVDDGTGFWVDIPLSSMECYGWSMYDDVLQLTNINMIYIALDAGFYRNKDVYVDSISIVGDNLVDVGTAATTTTTPAGTTTTTTPAGTTTTTTPAGTTTTTTPAGATTTTTPAGTTTTTPAGTTTQNTMESSGTAGTSDVQTDTSPGDGQPSGNAGLLIGIICGAIVLVAIAVVLVLKFAMHISVLDKLKSLFSRK